MSRSSSRSSSGSRDVRGILVNIATVALALLVGYLLISLLIRHVFKPPVDATRTGEPGSAVIQVDVLNGCGIGGAASSATSYLRARRLSTGGKRVDGYLPSGDGSTGIEDREPAVS